MDSESKEALARMTRASDDVKRGQICIHDLYGYLWFVASLPVDKEAFLDDHRLHPEAEKEMNNDIEEIVRSYSDMRKACSTFENGTFEEIIKMGEQMKIYANRRKTRIEWISGEINFFLDSRKSQGHDSIIRSIRNMALEEGRSEELDKEIAKAEACQKDITKFRQQTRGHLNDIKRKQARQERKITSEQGFRGQLTSHVQFIKEQATVYEYLGKVEAKFWVHFVGMVPLSFREDAECLERIKIIQSSIAEEFTQEKLCLYRELIKDSLEKVEHHIEKAHEVVGQFEGVFRLFRVEIKIMHDQLKNFQGEKQAQTLRHFISPFCEALDHLEKSAHQFISNANTLP